MTPVTRLFGRTALVLLPAILVFLYLTIKERTGPYFLSGNLDPDYVYLFNALNIAIGRPPLYFDHPGTPLQLAGALLIRLNHWNQNEVATAVSTFTRSETYLTQMNLAVFAAVLLVYVAGTVLVWKKTGRLLPCLLFQAGFFLLGQNVYSLARFNPEPVLWLVGLALALILYLGSERLTARDPTLLAASSMLAATGVAVKITFAPMALVPFLCVRGGRARLVWASLFVLVLLIWLTPIYSFWDDFLKWIRDLAWHKGRYGTGERGVLDLALYGRNLQRLLLDNLPFVGLLGLSSMAVWAGNAAQPGKGENTRSSVRLLLILIACQWAQFLMIAKFSESRHFIPAMSLGALNLLWLEDWARSWPRQRRLSCAWLVGLLLAGGVAETAVLGRELERKKQNHLAVVREVHTRYGESAKIFCYNSSSHPYALFFGDLFVDQIYKSVLAQLPWTRPDTLFFYNNFRDQYHTYTQTVSLPEIRQKHSSVIFQSPPFKQGDFVYPWPKNVALEEVGGGPYEKIYRVQP